MSSETETIMVLVDDYVRQSRGRPAQNMPEAREAIFRAISGLEVDELRATLAWKSVKTDGMPPCDGETVYVGENGAGFLGCFNFVDAEGICIMNTAEGDVCIFSDLAYWRVQDQPQRNMEAPK